MGNTELIREARKDSFYNKKQKSISNKLNGTKMHVDHFACRGIYFLYYENEIVYVGQSKDSVMMRICQHEREGLKVFDNFTIYPKRNYSDSELDKEEKKYILKYSPKYNIVHNKLDDISHDNRNECKHEFPKYTKDKPCNYCVKCKKI